MVMACDLLKVKQQREDRMQSHGTPRACTALTKRQASRESRSDSEIPAEVPTRECQRTRKKSGVLGRGEGAALCFPGIQSWYSNDFIYYTRKTRDELSAVGGFKFLEIIIWLHFRP